MTISDQTIETCNALLCREISAVETYTQAIEKYDPTACDLELERIRGDHQGNVFELQKLITECGGQPSSNSGAWCGFDQALESTETLLGESPALKSLQTGEGHNISQYEHALANADVSIAAKALIRKVILPSLSGHLVELQQRRDRGA